MVLILNTKINLLRNGKYIYVLVVFINEESIKNRNEVIGFVKNYTMVNVLRHGSNAKILSPANVLSS